MSFVAMYDVANLVANGRCVEPGMSFVHTEVPGMFYPDFAPFDGAPPVAKTLGPQGTAAFLTKGADLISQLEQRIVKRVPELSF
jgi:hypothetical protein